MVDPYVYVRSITLGLGTLWILGGLVRTIRFAARWERRLTPLGISQRWLRRQILIATLRATILDPINLALLLVLLGSWSVRALAR